MSKPDFAFKITRDVHVQAEELDRNLIAILCKTDQGKSIRIEADFRTLEKLHEEIRKQLDTL